MFLPSDSATNPSVSNLRRVVALPDFQGGAHKDHWSWDCQSPCSGEKRVLSIWMDQLPKCDSTSPRLSFVPPSPPSTLRTDIKNIEVLLTNFCKNPCFT